MRSCAKQTRIRPMGIERVSDLTDHQCREIAGMAETNHI